jgi:hypothetical protein
MEATGYVAIYAAAVSTGSLGWQVWNSYRARRPQVSVLLDTWRTNQVPGRQSLEDATIRIRNREDYTVRVDRIYLRYPGQPFWPHVPAVIDSGDVVEVPFDVPAREVVSLIVRAEGEYRFPRPTQLGREFVPGVGVELRTGERYRSRPAQR